MKKTALTTMFAALGGALVATCLCARPAASWTPPPAPAAPPAASSEGGTVYGLFIGINDYGGENHALPYDVQSARSLAQAFTDRGLIRPDNAVVLTESAATPAGVRRAFDALAPRVTAADTFVFFFNGHGGPRSIQLRHGSLSARELGSMLDRVAGAQVLAIDSCDSGGLASIVGRAPRRVGFFSARADETSYDATEYEMGGWLSYFLLEAVRGGVPAGPDGAIRVGDLARYLAAGYDDQVTQQHLVVRGPSELALFRAPAPGDRGNDQNVAPPSEVAQAPTQRTVVPVAPTAPTVTTVTTFTTTVASADMPPEALQALEQAQRAVAQAQLVAAQAEANAQAQVASARAMVATYQNGGAWVVATSGASSTQ